MNPKLFVAIAAGTGGIAPNLIHLGQGMLQQLPTAIPGLMYFGGMSIFFGLGAMVAMFFAETNARKAFLLGIGLPALIATAQNHPGRKVGLMDLFPTAYAQSPAAIPSIPPASSSAVSIPERRVAISVELGFECKGCELWFADSTGQVLTKNVLASQNIFAKTWTIPSQAKKVAIIDPKSNARFVSIPQDSGATVNIEFDRKYSPWSDFRRGLGAYDLKSYEQVIEIKK